MKLSFSTNYWQSHYTVDQFIAIASEYKFKGIEIHDVHAVTDPAEPGKATALHRRLMENRLSVSCLDLVADIADDKQTAMDELTLALDAAKRLHSSYIRVRTHRTGEAAEAAAREFLKSALPAAETAKVPRSMRLTSSASGSVIQPAST